MSVEKFTDSYNSYSFDKIYIAIGNRVLIDNQSISIAPEKRYGIIGKNGAGKTTLMKFINQKIGTNSIYTDQYVTDDIKDWHTMNIVELVLRANPERCDLIQEYNDAITKYENNELTDDQFENITDKLSSLNVDKDESEVKTVLRKLGFTADDLEKSYDSFSGGLKTRINLARTLYMKPKVLLLDEPTNHLDLEGIIWLETYLQNCKSIIIVVSHNVHFLNTICTNIIYLNNSKINVYNGNYYKFLKQHTKELELQEKSWNKLQKDIAALKAKGKSKEAVALQKKNVHITRPDKPYAIKMDFVSDTNVKSPYIKIKGISFSYPNKEIIRNLDLMITNETRMTIIGPNGCGKTTLMKLIYGDLIPDSGDVTLASNLRISYFNQHSIENLPSDLTPIEYLQKKYYLAMKEIRKILGKIALDSKEHKKTIGSLSGGQKMRIVFAGIIIEEPNLILFDEPTNHLDLETIDTLIESINTFKGSIITISHDIDLIERTDCEIQLLDNYKLTRLDSIDDYIKMLAD